MEYRIIEKPAFQVIGKALRVSTKEGENRETIPAFWNRSFEDGTFRALHEMISEEGTLGHVSLGICMEFQHEQHEFTYLIAVEKSQSAAPAGFVEKEIPAATWAVFEFVGPMPETIQKVWGRIFSEFFPSSGFAHAPGGPELEIYFPGNAQDEGGKCEVWIPIVKKPAP